MGRFLMMTGFLMVLLGAIIHFKAQLPWGIGWVGKLPGDLVLRKGNATLFFPLTTSLLASILLSLLLSLLRNGGKS